MDAPSKWLRHSSVQFLVLDLLAFQLPCMPTCTPTPTHMRYGSLCIWGPHTPACTTQANALWISPVTGLRLGLHRVWPLDPPIPSSLMHGHAQANGWVSQEPTQMHCLLSCGLRTLGPSSSQLPGPLVSTVSSTDLWLLQYLSLRSHICMQNRVPLARKIETELNK